MDDTPGRLLNEQGEAMDFIRARRSNYLRAFSSPDGQRVLCDLIHFCRGAQTVWAVDPREHALLTGRNEVWQRIAQHLNLSSTELFKLYTNQDFGRPILEED